MLTPRWKRALIALLALSAMTACGGSQDDASSAKEDDQTSATEVDGADSGDAAEEVEPGSPVKIGLVGTLSGPVGATLTPVRDGVKAWVDAVNDAGGCPRSRGRAGRRGRPGQRSKPPSASSATRRAAWRGCIRRQPVEPRRRRWSRVHRVKGHPDHRRRPRRSVRLRDALLLPAGEQRSGTRPGRDRIDLHPDSRHWERQGRVRLLR